MTAQPSQSTLSVFDRWRAEDRDLEVFVGEMRDWMKEKEVEQLEQHEAMEATTVETFLAKISLEGSADAS